jgi:hypothetical protein
MPPRIPVRRTDDDYDFHAYDYVGSGAPGKGPFELSDAQPDRHGWRFFSLAQDLYGLWEIGVDRHVPGIAFTSLGPPLASLTPGIEPRILQLSFGGGGAAAPTVVITGGIHAREWIAAEFAYLLAEYLIIHYPTAPNPSRYERAIQRLLDYRRIRIIPMLNPAGNVYTVFGPATGARMWRKNLRPLPMTADEWVLQLTTEVYPPPAPRQPNYPFWNVQAPMPPADAAQYWVPDYDPAYPEYPNYRPRVLANGSWGVDLNRNYYTASWGFDGVPLRQQANYDPRSETYFGPNRGSEMETAILQAALASEANPGLAAVIDYHSYGKVILYPTEAFNTGAVDDEYRFLGRTLRRMIGPLAGEEYQLGTSAQLLHYNTTGTVTDHAAWWYQARAFTIELDPSDTGQGDAGFDLPRSQIRTVFEKNIRGALAAIAAAAYPTSRSRRGGVPPAVSQFMVWNVYGQGNQLPQ